MARIKARLINQGDRHSRIKTIAANNANDPWLKGGSFLKEAIVKEKQSEWR